MSEVVDLLKRQRELDDLADEINLTIIGQASAKCGRLPMFPLPKGSAGWHLYDLMNVTMDEYLATDRRNLIDYYPGPKKGGGDVFPIHEARSNAERITRSLGGRSVLLMGRTVASAFRKGMLEPKSELNARPVLQWFTDEEHGYDYAIFPHTSRINRFWSEERNEKRARLFLKNLYNTRFYGESDSGK